MSFWRFLKYNNAVPITLSLILLSFGTTLAASPEIREGVAESMIASERRVIAIDNTYIANKDLSSYTPRVEISGVTENAEAYFVGYRFYTIDLKDSVWQDVIKEETLQVGKDALGDRDLGAYATRELKQRVDRELALLREVQQLERRQVTQKTVATTYSGLIGTFIDERTEVAPEYVPPTPEPVASVPSASEPSAAPSAPSATPSAGGAGAPRLQVLGNNPATLSLGDVYNDLGVLVTDDSGADLGYKTFLDGKEVLQIRIPSTVDATYTITYAATDGAGNTGTATRTVIMGKGTPAPEPAIDEGATSASTTPTEEAAAPQPSATSTAGE